MDDKIDHIQDDGLRSRAQHLKNVVDARWANSTKMKYKPAWERWVEWCRKYPESSTMPADPFYIAVYLNDLVLNEAKIGTLDAAVCGIRWGHVKEGLENPMDNLFVKTVLIGARKIIGKGESRQQDPFTSDMAKKVVKKFGKQQNLMNHRLIVICLLGFTGVMRISELLEIKIGNMKFSSLDLQITIPKAKNDQNREGHVVYIARTKSEFCPVTWTEKYVKETKLDKQPEAFLLCRLAKTARGHNAHGHLGLSDTTVRDIFNKEVRPICEEEEPGAYCLHSLRSGGSSTACNNGISERLIGKHGRWKSGYSRDRYLKDSRSKRLSVSKAMGL